MKKITITVLLLGLITFTFVSAVMLGHTAMIVPRFSAFLAQKSIVPSAIRWALIALLAYFWRILIKFLAKWQAWPLDVEDQLMTLRWPLICYLVLFEVLVMQNTLACCLDFLAH